MNTKLKNSINVQNRLILERVACASTVIKQLIADGFTVLDVNVTAAKPVIEIQRTRRTEKLKGVMKKRGEDFHGVYRTLASVKYLGCQVEWTER